MRLARDGFSALLDAGKQPPDVLITDINLLGLDGVEMLRSLLLHPDTRQMRVVVVTHCAPAELQRFGTLPPGVPVLRKQAHQARSRADRGTSKTINLCWRLPATKGTAPCRCQNTP